MWSLKPSANPRDKAPLKCQPLSSFLTRSFGCFQKVIAAQWGPGVWVTAAALSVSVGVWKCVRVHVWFCRVCVCVCVCVWSGAEQKRTLIRRVGVCTTHWELENRGRLSSLLMLAEKPSGDHMPESAEESFCVINTKSLGVPCCQGPQQEVRRSQWILSKAQITTCQRGGKEGRQRIKQSKSCITLLITNSVGLQIPLPLHILLSQSHLCPGI